VDRDEPPSQPNRPSGRGRQERGEKKSTRQPVEGRRVQEDAIAVQETGSCGEGTAGSAKLADRGYKIVQQRGRSDWEGKNLLKMRYQR